MNYRFLMMHYCMTTCKQSIYSLVYYHVFLKFKILIFILIFQLSYFYENQYICSSIYPIILHGLEFHMQSNHESLNTIIILQYVLNANTIKTALWPCSNIQTSLLISWHARIYLYTVAKKHLMMSNGALLFHLIFV